MIDKSLSKITIGDTSQSADGTTTYSVFPGIEFSFVDVHGHQIIREKKIQDGNILEITYCREGRSEFNMGDEFFSCSGRFDDRRCQYRFTCYELSPQTSNKYYIILIIPRCM